MQNLSVRQWAVLGLLVNATVWGLSWIAFKGLQAQGLHSLFVTAGIYALAMVITHWLSPAATRAALFDRNCLAVLFAAGFTNVMFNSAMAMGDVVRVTLLFYLMPVWATLLSKFILHEALSRAAWLRLGVALLGAVCVLWQPNQGLPYPRETADWLGLGAGLAFALNNIFLRKAENVSDVARAQAMFIGGAVLPLLCAAVLWQLNLISLPQSISGSMFATWAFWAALFLVANYGVQYGAARLPAQLTAVIMLFEIVVAAGSSAALGAADLGWREWLGGALIIISPFLGKRT